MSLSMSFKKQRVTVLGSTGSVGVNTLDVIASHPERFEVFALSAATQVDLMLAALCRELDLTLVTTDKDFAALPG